MGLRLGIFTEKIINVFVRYGIIWLICGKDIPVPLESAPALVHAMDFDPSSQNVSYIYCVEKRSSALLPKYPCCSNDDQRSKPPNQDDRGRADIGKWDGNEEYDWCN